MPAFLENRRAEDRNAHYQSRPMVVSVGGERLLLSPSDTQFLLAELTRLPEWRWPGAGVIRRRLVVGLTRGVPVAIAPAEEPVLVRAVEAARARRPLTTGLRELRSKLVR